MLAYKCRGEAGPLITTPFDKIFFVFIVIMGLSFFISINKQETLNQIVYFSCLYLWYWTILNLPKDNNVKKIILATVILSGIFVIGYGLFQYVFGFSAMRSFAEQNPQYIINSAEFMRRFKQNAVFSTFLYPPSLAGYLGVIFLAALGIYLKPDNLPKKNHIFQIKKLFFLFILISIIPLIILTKSKGGWLSLFCGLGVFVFMSKKGTTIIKAIAFCLVFALAFTLIGQVKMINLPNFNNILASIQVRQEYGKATLEMIKARPMFGFGAGSFGSIYPLYKTRLAEETVMAHNSFLQTAAELGLVGLVAFILLWAMFLKSGHTLIKNERTSVRAVQLGLYAAVFSFLVHNLFDFGLYLGQISIIIFSLMAISFLLETREESSLNQKIILSQQSKISLLVAGLLLFMLLALHNNCRLISDYYDQKAAFLMRSNDIQNADRFVDKAIILSPLNARYRFHKAVISEARALDPSQPIAIQEGSINKTITDYNQAIALEPYLPYYHFRLGRFLIRQKNIVHRQKGLEQAEKAASLYPVNPFYHAQLAGFYDIMGQTEKAAKEKDMAADLSKYYKKGTR